MTRKIIDEVFTTIAAVAIVCCIVVAIVCVFGFDRIRCTGSFTPPGSTLCVIQWT